MQALQIFIFDWFSQIEDLFREVFGIWSLHLLYDEYQCKILVNIPFLCFGWTQRGDMSSSATVAHHGLHH